MQTCNLMCNIIHAPEGGDCKGLAAKLGELLALPLERDTQARRPGRLGQTLLGAQERLLVPGSVSQQ